MIGTALVSGRDFSRRQTSMPETLGSIQSSTIRSGASSATIRSASSPLSACATR